MSKFTDKAKIDEVVSYLKNNTLTVPDAVRLFGLSRCVITTIAKQYNLLDSLKPHQRTEDDNKARGLKVSNTMKEQYKAGERISPLANPVINDKSHNTQRAKIAQGVYDFSNSPFKKLDIQQKAKKTKLDRYGDENYHDTEKAKQTKLEKYGDANYNNKERTKQTNLDRYNGTGMASAALRDKHNGSMLAAHGVEHNWASKDPKLNGQDTRVRKYGVKSVSQLSEYKDRIRDTKINLYGNCNNSTKIKETMLKRYGTEYALANSDIREKRKVSMISLYGTEFPLQNIEIRSKAAGSSKVSKLEKRFEEFLKTKNIEYQSQYIVKNEDKIHTYNFAVFKAGQLQLLVDCDGIYYHGYISDFNGIKVKDDYDEIRLQLIPSNIKFIKVVEGQEEEGYKEVLKAFDIDYDQYIQDMFNWCRSIEFPYPNYSNKLLYNSYDSIKSNQYLSTRSRQGDKLIHHFHKSIYKANKKNHLSPYEAWYDDNILLSTIKNRLIYKDYVDPSRVLYGFSASKKAPKISVFSAALAKYLIEKYLMDYQEIFDPCSGYSGRLLGALALDKKYIGQDINPITIEESSSLLKFLNKDASLEVKDSLQIKGTYDCLFTCPPYKDAENWNQDIKELSEDQWIEACLKNYKCKSYLFVVGSTIKYKQYIIEELENKSHYSSNSKEFVILIKGE